MEAVNASKLQLTWAPILSFHDERGDFILQMHASKYGIGAVLTHNHEGEVKCVVFLNT